MTEAKITTGENGPLAVTGIGTLVDHLGNEYELEDGASIYLCRCGASRNRPFCDGSHRKAGFIANEIAPSARTDGETLT